MSELDKKVYVGLMLDGRYKLLRPLSSEGGTADVWLALDTNTIDEEYDESKDDVTAKEETGLEVAIKIYRPKNALDIGEQRFREEFKIVFKCHHTNLLQPINFSICDGMPYLVLPYCKKGSSETLFGKINDAEKLWKYISDVSAGLAYLHSFDPTIVHHDIKPANVLIDDSGNYAITDFGISSHRGINREGYDTTQSGTMAYMAPERFKDDYESIPESDIWSFGATLYELVTGKVPFGEKGGLAQLDGSWELKAISEPVPHEVKTLIADCLSLDPSKRPTAMEICRTVEDQSAPHKKKPWIIASAALFVFVGVFAGIWLYRSGHDTDPSPAIEKPVVRPDAEIYEEAMAKVSSEDEESMRRGLATLDSLGSKGYVPALYELAYTYGYYSDPESMRRKMVLGIDFYGPNEDKNYRYLPKSYQVNLKAIGLFTDIAELEDSAWPAINANAFYRLACYYFNDNKLLKRDPVLAKKYLLKAREWAKICNDSIVASQAEAGLKLLNN